MPAIINSAKKIKPWFYYPSPEDPWESPEYVHRFYELKRETEKKNNQPKPADQ